jgi:hypothetical protein
MFLELQRWTQAADFARDDISNAEFKAVASIVLAIAVFSLLITAAVSD